MRPSDLNDQTQPARADDGFALASVMVLITSMFLLLAALAFPLSNDVSSLRRARYVAESRQLAESVINELFSQGARGGDTSGRPAMIGEVDPVADDGTPRSVDWAGPYAGWARYDQSTGRFVQCSTTVSAEVVALYREADNRPVACYYYSLLTQGSTTIVEVTTRSGCSADGANCVFRRYQQRWKRRQFVNYLIFTDQETLAPVLYDGGTTTNASGVPVTRGLQVQYGTTLTEVTQALASANCAGSNPAAVPPASDPGYVFERSRRQREAAPASGATRPVPDANTERGTHCFDSAYTSADDLNGPIHTNDRWIWFCGAPRFAGNVEMAGNLYGKSGGPGSADPKKLYDFDCSANGTPVYATGFASVVAEPLQLPSGISGQRRLAAVVLQSTGAGLEIELDNNRYRTRIGGGAWTSYTPQPSRGLIYVEGTAPVRVMGGNSTAVDATGVTIMTEADLIIGNGSVAHPANAEVLGVPASVESATIIRGTDIGLVSLGNIRIGSAVSAAVPNGPVLHAAILALGKTSPAATPDGTIYVDGWRTLPGNAGIKLTFVGSLIAQYRPVFGTYEPNAGTLKTGLGKDLTYPTPAPNPPYFLEPVNAVWERLDLAEIPLRTENTGSLLRPWEGGVDGTRAGLTPVPSRTPLAKTFRDGKCAGQTAIKQVNPQGVESATIADNYLVDCLMFG